MLTETERAADRAWWGMLRDINPMPAGVALDHVQDACDDRDEAVCALLMAAAVYLDGLRPEQPLGDISTSMNIAISVRGHVLGESYTLAENPLAELDGLNREIRNACYAQRVYGDGSGGGLPYTDADDERAAAWLRWCDITKKVIGLCRTISAAAHPVT